MRDLLFHKRNRGDKHADAHISGEESEAFGK